MNAHRFGIDKKYFVQFLASRYCFYIKNDSKNASIWNLNAYFLNPQNEKIAMDITDITCDCSSCLGRALECISHVSYRTTLMPIRATVRFVVIWTRYPIQTLKMHIKHTYSNIHYNWIHTICLWSCIGVLHRSYAHYTLCNVKKCTNIT